MPSRRVALRGAVAGVAALLGLAGLGGSARTGSPAVLLSVDAWRERFDADLARRRGRGLRWSTTGDSAAFYPLAYEVDGWTSMGLATGEVAYLEAALELVENVVATARPSRQLPGAPFRDGWTGWVAAGSGSREVPLYESYLWRYVTQLLVAVGREHPERDDLGRRAASLLDFTREQILAKWLARGEQYVYRERTHLAAHWAAVAVGTAALLPPGPARDAVADVAGRIDDDLPTFGSSLRRQLRVTGDGGYEWSDVWDGTVAQDTSHANGVVSYVCVAHDLAGTWGASDLDRFSRCLARIRPAGGVEAGFVDGTGRGNGFVSDGWAKLGRYDPTVQGALQTAAATDTQFLGVMALNRRRLDSVSAGAATTPP